MINRLFKGEVFHGYGPWRSFEAVDYSTLAWIDWLDNRRPLETIENIAPTEAGANVYAALGIEVMVA